MASIEKRAADVRLLALDVDSVMTDCLIYYGNSGDELQTFNIKDSLGIKLLQNTGVKVAIITGRQSAMLARRARELDIEDVIQGREDRRQGLLELCQFRSTRCG